MPLQYQVSTVSEALPVILSDLLEYGDEVGSRNGRVKELLNTQIVINQPQSREVLSIGRKANVYAQIAETMWVLSGRNDIEWLSAYLPRAKDYSDDGEVWRAGYGPRIRRWRGIGWATGRPEVDQLDYVIETLKKDPLSRQAVIQIWDAAMDTEDDLKDRACNTQLQFLSRLGRLHLTVTVRSNDVMWGWSGINAFEWSTLQEIVASLLGIQVGPLTFNIGSLHLYEPHWDKASRIRQETYSLPTIAFNPDRMITSLSEVDRQVERWFSWEALCREGKATRTLLEEWEEPLFKSWAAAIAYYWQRDLVWLDCADNTALAMAMARTPASVLPEPVQRPLGKPLAPNPTGTLSERSRAFYEFASELHAAKHASYGDSWKKRGEKMSILANIARKADRLGVGDQYDTSADTLVDFWIYLAKYRCWLFGQDDGPDNVNLLLAGSLQEMGLREPEPEWWTSIPNRFNYYVDVLDTLSVDQKADYVLELMNRAAPIARDLWLAENTVDEYRVDLGQ